MSHFTVAVVTDAQPSFDELAAILQPFHEYECTGEDDQYVIDVDVTDELKADHEKYGEGQPFGEFVEGWTSAKLRDDGRWYRHTNPNAKWDWWKVGGRWSGLLKLKALADAEPILGEPGLMGMRASDEPGATDQARLDTIESVPTTFAVVKDGQWFERGKMGWWAAVSDDKGDAWPTEFAKLMDALPRSSWVTIVDCHI